MDNFTETRARIVEINEGLVREHLAEMVRSRVEDTLNKLLDSEAERLCNAEKFERTERRKDSRAGHYKRSLDTRAGRVQ